MEQEKYERAIEIKDDLKRLRRLKNEANHIAKCHNDFGTCRQYWGEISDLLWSDEEFKKKTDTRLFCLLEEYNVKVSLEIRNLEEEFERL